MSVELDPPELGFRRPFTHEVTQILRLANPNSEPVAFKVKTTAPKQYCVRPNSGRIEPGQNVEIQVLLQAMKEDPPLEAKCRDKFLVQSVGIPADADANVASIWSNIEKTNKSSIQERKIRVSFLPSHDSSTGASASNTPQHHSVNGALASSQMSDHDGPPPAYNSPPSQNYGSPASSSTKAAPPDREAPSAPFSTAKDPAASSSTGSATTTAGVISNSVSNAASATQQTLQQQLENAKAQIAALQKSATESGASLKQRAVGGDERSGGRALAQAPGQAAAEGVPVQIVAALCLLSFLLAYFLF